MENDINSKSSIAKKILKILLKILYQIVIIVCVILILIIVLQKISDSNRSIAGYRIFRVITGSMEPEYQVGEVVISKEVPAEDIKVGDDIVYRGTYGEYAGKIIMHEVIKIDRDENNKLNFHAKGLLSASVEDPQIKEEQIYGVVKVKSRLIALLYDLATNIYTAFVIITILVLNVFISFKFSGKKDVQQLSEARTGDTEEYMSEMNSGEEIGEDVDEDSAYDDDDSDDGDSVNDDGVDDNSDDDVNDDGDF